MYRYSIRAIIALATFLLTLLVITQVFWVKEAYTIAEKQFTYKVTQVLLRTLDNVQRQAGDSSIIVDPIEQEKPNFFVIRTHDVVHPEYLQALLKTEFNLVEINEPFEFNIYDCFSDSVVYCRHVNMGTHSAATEIPDITWDADEGHYFSVYFPNHAGNIIKKMNFWIFSSIILIVVIAFFGYIISALLKQKKLNQMKTDFINNMTHEFKTLCRNNSIGKHPTSGTCRQDTADSHH